MSKIKIVATGGANGTGSIVRALKPFRNEVELTAIVSMSDSGRSAGKIREEIQQLPPADILRVLIAGSTTYSYKLLKELFYDKRFESHEKINYLNIGSLLIALTSKYTEDLMPVVQDLERILDSYAKVFPATLNMTDLRVELSDGTVIVGEGNIDEPEISDPDNLITRAWLEPTGTIYKKAAQAITEADIIITGPGDLYTSNIASLLAQGTKEAIAASKAHLMYVAGNKYSIMGEAAPRSLSERVQSLENYLPRKVDSVMYSPTILTAEQAEHYKNKQWGMIIFDENNLSDYTLLNTVFERTAGGLSKKKMGKILIEHIRNVCK